MAATIDEITMNYEDENGILRVKELEKQVLSKGAYSTIMFKYQDFVDANQDYGPEKFSIRRYRKLGGVFRQDSKFNISSVKQANLIIETLTRWVAESEAKE